MEMLVKEGSLFTVVPSEGSHLAKIGDRSYITDIFLCVSAEQRSNKRMIVSGIRLEKHLNKTLTQNQQSFLYSGMSEFSTHEYDIELYNGDFKFVPNIPIVD